MTAGHIGRGALQRMAVRIPCPVCSTTIRYSSVRTHLKQVHGATGRSLSALIDALRGSVWVAWSATDFRFR